MVNISDFLAHALSWIKTYDDAKFQRNSPTGLARMIVQTYRHLLLYIYWRWKYICRGGESGGGGGGESLLLSQGEAEPPLQSTYYFFSRCFTLAPMLHITCIVSVQDQLLGKSLISIENSIHS